MNVNETQLQVRFIADNPQPKVMKQHMSILKSIYEDVYDAQLSSKIPLLAVGGTVCWPDNMDATKFTYEYDFSSHSVAYRFADYVRSRDIDPGDLALAMRNPDRPAWQDLLEKARKIL